MHINPNRTSHVDLVIKTCVQASLSMPPSKRASLYLGIAAICSDEPKSADFKRVAQLLEHADTASRAIALDYLP